MRSGTYFKALVLSGVIAFTGCSAADNDMSQISDTSMPEPFGNVSGDENNDFYLPFVPKFNNIGDFVYDLAGDDDAFQLWVEDTNKNETPYRLEDNINLYSFMVHFDISGEDVCAALREYNEMQEKWQDERDIPINPTVYFSDDELEAIESEDKEAIVNSFASDYSIVVGDNVYSPNWIYYHTADDYADCGITPEILREYTDKYSGINFVPDAAAAFESKLSDFTGEAAEL